LTDNGHDILFLFGFRGLS